MHSAIQSTPQSVAAPATWPAELRLEYFSAKNRTYVHREHVGPLSVQRPFYPEGNTCHTVILHPPAGIVGGDRLDITVNAKAHSHALLTTPGATRFYGSDGRQSQQIQRLALQNAIVEWLPQETLYFDNCRAKQKLSVDLDNNSRFIGWDITCFGRPAGEQLFSSGEVRVGLDITIEKKIVLKEQLVVSGAVDLQRITGLRGNMVTATMIACAPSVDTALWMPMVRDTLPDKCFAATLTDQVMIIRYLGDHTETVKKTFVELWRILRPLMIQQPACEPRIWST